MSDRHEELAASLAAVRARVDSACSQAGRDPAAVALCVVTKFFPASDVRLLAGLGVTDVAENRHQEAQAKAEECADLGLRWHMVGALQSNKAAAVASWADVVASLDRPKLVGALARGAERAGRTVDVLVQVSLDPPGAEHRAGVDPGDPAVLAALAASVAADEHLHLRGLMAVAPFGVDPTPAFERLAALHRTLLEAHPAAVELSAGMSGDLEAAIRAGATRVRVGSAVLGPRPGVA